MDSETGFRLAFIALATLFLLVRFYYAFPAWRAGRKIFRGDRENEGLAGILLVRAAASAFYALLIAYALFPQWIAGFAFPVPEPLRWIGALLALASTILIAWAHRALGTYWSFHLTLEEGHRLVTTGPYAWIRHPMYLAAIVFYSGLTLLSANLLVVLLGIISIAAVLSRIGREEKMLIKTFGREYEDYRQRTGSLFPKL